VGWWEFRPVIQILRLTVLNRASNLALRRLVAAQLVGNHYPGHVLQTLEQLAKEPGRGLGVPPRGDQNVQDIPVLVDGAPQVLPLTVDREEYLVEMPRIAGPGPTATQPVGVGLPELHAPLPDGFVGHHDPALQHHLLHLAEAQREPVVQPHTMTDDLHRVAEPSV
jgi:hypothetical protein